MNLSAEEFDFMLLLFWIFWCFFFTFSNLGIITQLYFSPLFPPFKQSYIPLLGLIQIHGLFIVAACNYVYIYTYILLNIICSVYIILLVCIFSGPTIWYWVSNWCALLWRRVISSILRISYLPTVLCGRLRPGGLSPTHFF